LDNPAHVTYYKGELSNLEDIIAFLNKNCYLDRSSTGELNWRGQAKKELLGNLFSVKKLPEDNQFVQDGEHKCEKISQPTPEYFLKNYVMHSKPVIITGGKIGK
jgi:hypothetical protein